MLLSILNNIVLSIGIWIYLDVDIGRDRNKIYEKTLCLFKNNSFAVLNPKLCKEWHPNKNGKLTPDDVTAASGKKVLWQCAQGHEWEAQISNRNHGTGCPSCRRPCRKPKALS